MAPALSALAEGRAHVHRLDGSFVYGRIQNYAPDQSADVLVTAQEESHRIPLDQVSGADLGGIDVKDATEKSVQISYTDGTVLGGTLKSIKDGNDSTTDYADQPIESDLSGAYVLNFKSDAVSHEHAGRCPRASAPSARWPVPVGKEGRLGWEAGRQQERQPVVIQGPSSCCSKVSAVDTPPADGKREMIYLRNGDIIPCRVISIGQELVDVAPAFASVTSIPRDQVKAIALASKASEAVLEFDHPSWMIRAGDEKTVKRSAAKAVFTDSATMSHMDLLAGDSLQFDVAWTANEPVSVTVGWQTHNLRRSAGLNFKLYFNGEQVHVQGLRTNQGFVYRHRLRERTANIQISLRSNRFQMRINGDTVLNQPIESGVLRGRGVAFAVNENAPYLARFART